MHPKLRPLALAGLATFFLVGAAGDDDGCILGCVCLPPPPPPPIDHGPEDPGCQSALNDCVLVARMDTGITVAQCCQTMCACNGPIGGVVDTDCISGCVARYSNPAPTCPDTKCSQDEIDNASCCLECGCTWGFTCNQAKNTCESVDNCGDGKCSYNEGVSHDCCVDCTCSDGLVCVDNLCMSDPGQGTSCQAGSCGRVSDGGTPSTPGNGGALAARDAQFVSQNVPFTMVADRSYVVGLTVQNIGTTTWTPTGSGCNAYVLGSQNPQDNTWWNYGRLGLPGPVAPGQMATIAFSVVAPHAPGVYPFQWRMLQECAAWFGSPSPNVAVTVSVDRDTTDFNADRQSDLVWQHDDGRVYVWWMKGSSQSGGGYANATALPGWKVVATGDFNRDQKPDLVWQHDDGRVYVWFMNGLTHRGGGYLQATALPDWRVAASGDFDGDGKTDLLWQNTDGSVYVWLLDGLGIIRTKWVLPQSLADWRIVASGDFNRDAVPDLVWQHTDGRVNVWFMNKTVDGTTVTNAYVRDTPLADWRVRGTGDFNADHKTDLVWQKGDGSVYVWYLNGVTLSSSGWISSQPLVGWTVRASK